MTHMVKVIFITGIFLYIFPIILLCNRKKLFKNSKFKKRNI